MRNYWNFAISGRVCFGNGSLERINSVLQVLQVKNPLIVTDHIIKDIGILSKLEKLLKESGFSYTVFDKGEPEPRVEKCVEGYIFSKSFSCDSVIGLGGGSVIDLAKGIALLISHGGKLSDYFGENKVPGSIIPMIAIPTTAGTGSEVTSAAIFTDKDNNSKVGISDNYLRPAYALVDPLLTVSVPAKVTADTGADVLSHAVESFLSVSFQYLPVPPEQDAVYCGSTDLTRCLAKEAIKLTCKSLRTAVFQGNNLEARYDMALASNMAGMAFSNSGILIGHALAYPIGVLTNSSHGSMVGMLLPPSMEYNKFVCLERMAELAEVMGQNTNGLTILEAAQKSVLAVRELLQDIGLPLKLREIGVKREELEELAEKTMLLQRVLKTNPSLVTKENLTRLLEKAW